MTDSTGLRFIGIFPGLSPKGDFILRDLPGSGKRVDVLCRSLAACFDWCPDLTSKLEIEFVAVLPEDIVLRFSKPVHHTGKGETWWATIVRKSLQEDTPEFVTKTDMELENLLRNEPSKIFVLEEGGIPLSSLSGLEGTSQYSFMLGDHRGFNEHIQEIIHDLAIPRVSLGTISYLGSHCIAAVISHFERMN